MDLQSVLKELREELSLVNEAILTLERMAAGKHRGPGRPPKWIAEAKAEPKRRGRPSNGTSAAGTGG
jgi:hypothetical protein